jgi:hypothetical protein
VIRFGVGGYMYGNSCSFAQASKIKCCDFFSFLVPPISEQGDFTAELPCILDNHFASVVNIFCFRSQSGRKTV